MIDDELFNSWLDGELAAAEAERVAAAVAADPALQRRVEQYRALTGRLRTAFDPVLEQQVAPPCFGAAGVIDFKSKREEKLARRVAFGVPQWAAMAATLAIGIVAGQFIGRGPASPVEIRDGALVASASLDRALDTQLASSGPNGSVRIGLTFRDRSGSICRSFSGEAGRGLACRDDGDWRMEGLFPSPHGQASTYRMAAGDDPRIAALIDQRIAGDPFDAAAEEAARNHGWD